MKRQLEEFIVLPLILIAMGIITCLMWFGERVSGNKW